MSWLREWRINTLRVQLAGARAAERTERELANVVRQCAPVVLVNHARRVAELEESLRQAEGPVRTVIAPPCIDCRHWDGKTCGNVEPGQFRDFSCAEPRP